MSLDGERIQRFNAWFVWFLSASDAADAVRAEEFFNDPDVASACMLASASAPPYVKYTPPRVAFPHIEDIRALLRSRWGGRVAADLRAAMNHSRRIRNCTGQGLRYRGRSAQPRDVE